MGVSTGGIVVVTSGTNPIVGSIFVAVGEEATGRLTGQHIHARVRHTDAIKIPLIGFFMVTYRKYKSLTPQL
jgi:hypothetical protein